jgi:hypothetical protein
MKTPLCIAVIRPGSVIKNNSLQSPFETQPYMDAIRSTFLGASESTTDDSALLTTGEFREYFPKDVEIQDRAAAARWLDSVGFSELALQARYLLVILLDGRDDERSGAATAISPIERAIVESARTEHFQLLSFFTSHGGALWSNRDAQLRRFGLADLDERDLRIPFLGLYVLHAAVSLLALPGNAAKLFFSHAKRDGVPLATAVRDWMKRLKGFAAFYDTENLDLDQDIEAQLSAAVATAIIIVLRSEIFDQRYWCQREVIWAEQFGRPVIGVDTRWQLEHGPSVISFDGMPTVRIPDGSFVRIFAAAMREAVRVSIFRVRVDEHRLSSAGNAALPRDAVLTLSRFPSLVSLHEACSKTSAVDPPRYYIVYPNPSLPDALRRAALGLASAEHTPQHFDRISIVSLDEFRLVI